MLRYSKFLLILFLIAFIVKSFITMSSVPLHDFDEANRSEAARNMKKYSFFLAPLNGSPFEKGFNLKIPAKSNPLLSLNYHLERPPLYYLSMIASTSLLGENEFAFRLPSFIFGVAVVLIFFVLGWSLFPSLAILTSSDWWLSSQSALMDTALSFFLFLSFLFLVDFLKSRRAVRLIFSGAFLGLAILSKGQPAVVFVFPLIFLIVTRRLSFKELVIFSLSAGVVLLPEAVPLIGKFGVQKLFYTLSDFSSRRTVVADPTQSAPFFWYFRWWLGSFRIGLILFLTLFLSDLKTRNFSLPKLLSLSYIVPSFVLFSVSKNKVWWYVLPLIPVVCYYIFLSVKKEKWLNLSVITFISAVPVFSTSSNKVALLWGVVLLVVSYFVYNLKLNLKNSFATTVIVFSLIFSLSIFFYFFPVISPTYPETVEVGEYYQKLPQPKCLFVLNMPYEAILFYSKAEAVEYFGKKPLLKGCSNYLVTPDKKPELKLLHRSNRLFLYRLPATTR